MKLLITCEHGGNSVPAKYQPLFRKHRALLDSHRGYDPGALAVARDFAAAFDAELIYSTTSRLVVELNRSLHHRALFSDVTRGLSPEERQTMLDRYYFPYRDQVDAQVRAAIAKRERVLHVSCHSFTPRLNGETRRADIGLLYDPRRKTEARFCSVWQSMLRAADPRLVVRRNYPYRGYADGLTTSLRQRYTDSVYAGMEIEVNQKFPLGNTAAWHAIRRVLVATLGDAFRASGCIVATGRNNA